MKLPDEGVTYPYYNVERYPTTGTSILAGASQTINSANIQLNSVPHRMYILARKQNSDVTLNDTDTFL